MCFSFFAARYSYGMLVTRMVTHLQRIYPTQAPLFHNWVPLVSQDIASTFFSRCTNDTFLYYDIILCVTISGAIGTVSRILLSSFIILVLLVFVNCLQSTHVNDTVLCYYFYGKTYKHAYIQTNKILAWKITNVKSSITNNAGYS